MEDAVQVEPCSEPGADCMDRRAPGTGGLAPSRGTRADLPGLVRVPFFVPPTSGTTRASSPR
eukprot:4624826-Pyramimonas_sp.AAC.1